MPCTNSQKQELYLFTERSRQQFEYTWSNLETLYTSFSLKIKGFTGTEYFKAKAKFNVYYSATSQTFNIRCLEITDICYENENSVSLSDRTDEYYYLYDVSCESSSSEGCFKKLCGDKKKNKQDKIICEDNTRDIYAILKSFINSLVFEVNTNTNIVTVTADITGTGLEQVDVWFKFSLNKYKSCGNLPKNDCCVPKCKKFNYKKLSKYIVIAVVVYFLHAIGVETGVFPEIKINLFDVLKNKLNDLFKLPLISTILNSQSVIPQLNIVNCPVLGNNVEQPIVEQPLVENA